MAIYESVNSNSGFVAGVVGGREGSELCGVETGGERTPVVLAAGDGALSPDHPVREQFGQWYSPHLIIPPERSADKDDQAGILRILRIVRVAIWFQRLRRIFKSGLGFDVGE